MNNRNTYILIFLVLSCLNSIAQFTFENEYSIVHQESGNSVLQCDDDGFLIGGRTNLSAYLIRTDEIGDTLWTRIYDFPNSIATSIQHTYDGGFVVGGSLYDGIKYFMLVMKLDSLGDTLWTKEYGAPTGSFDQGFNIRQTPDSGFIITGTTNNFGGIRGIFFVKINSSGVLEWAKKYNSTIALLDGVSACITSDGGYALTGTTHLFADSLRHIMIIRTDQLGDTIWTRCFKAAGWNNPEEIQAGDNGSVVVAGYSNAFNGTFYDAFLLKVDSLGNQEWAKSYGASEHETVNSLSVTADGGFLISGTTDSFSSLDDDAFVVKTDSTGVVEWSSVFGNTTAQLPGEAIQINDGGYIVCGTTDFGGIPLGKIFLVKLDSSGNSCTASVVSLPDSNVSFSGKNISMDVLNITPSELNLSGALSAGGLVSVICFDSGLCTGYNVNATASVDSVCHGFIQLNAVASTGSSVYEWKPAANLSNPFIANPDVHFSFNETFIVTATDTVTGCITSDSLVGITALNDFSETFRTCGSFTYDFFLPDGADSYLWTSYTDSTGISHPLNDTNQWILTVGAPAVYYGTADYGGCQVNGTYFLLDTCTTTGIQSESPGIVEMFPNPAGDCIFIKSSGTLNQVQVADGLGKIIYETHHAESTLRISTRGFKPGLYLVNIDDGRKIIHRKIQIIN